MQSRKTSRHVEPALVINRMYHVYDIMGRKARRTERHGRGSSIPLSADGTAKTGAQKGSGDGWWVSRASSDGATGHVILRIHPYGAPGAAGTGRGCLQGLSGRSLDPSYLCSDQRGKGVKARPSYCPSGAQLSTSIMHRVVLPNNAMMDGQTISTEPTQPPETQTGRPAHSQGC